MTISSLTQMSAALYSLCEIKLAWIHSQYLMKIQSYADF